MIERVVGHANSFAGRILWRRTATLRALIATGVLTNVVMLNFCYDVPVLVVAAARDFDRHARLLRALAWARARSS